VIFFVSFFFFFYGTTHYFTIANATVDYVHGENDFAEYRSDNNFVGILKIMSNGAKKF